jgi:hypothetical protein
MDAETLKCGAFAAASDASQATPTFPALVVGVWSQPTLPSIQSICPAKSGSQKSPHSKGPLPPRQRPLLNGRKTLECGALAHHFTNASQATPTLSGTVRAAFGANPRCHGSEFNLSREKRRSSRRTPKGRDRLASGRC